MMTFFSQAITHVRCPPAGSYFGVASALARYVDIMKIHTHQREKKKKFNKLGLDYSVRSVP